MQIIGKLFESQEDRIAKSIIYLGSEDKKIASDAVNKLVDIGPSVGPAVISALEDKKPEIEWKMCLGLLDALDDDKKEIVEELIDGLISDQAYRRNNTISTLEGMPADFQSTIHRISKAKQEVYRCRQARKNAIRILVIIGGITSDPEEIVNALIKTLLDDPSVAEAAQQALVELGRLSVPLLLQAFQSKEIVRRRLVLKILMDISENTPEVIVAFTNALSDVDNEVRKNAISALGNIGRPAEGSIPKLVKLAEVREYYPAISDALIRIDTAENIITARYISDTMAEVRSLSAEVAGRLRAKSTLPLLCKALSDDVGFVKAKAYWAIREIGPNEECLPFMIEAISRGSQNHDLEEAIGSIGEPAIPFLIPLLNRDQSEVRICAASALSKMGSKAEKAFPSMFRLLSDPDKNVRKEMIKFLGEMGPTAKDAVPLLIVSKDSVSESINTLGKIGDPRGIDPLLQFLFDNPSNGVPIEIESALNNLISGSQLTKNLVTLITLASTYKHTLRWGGDEGHISLEDSDDAVRIICSMDNNPISTNFLHLISRKNDISYHYSGTNDNGEDIPSLFTTDFKEQRKLAKDTLALRGNPPYRPEAYINI